MAAEKKYPVSLVVRATDKASASLKSMTSRFAAITGPFARKEFGKNLSALGEALNVDGFMKVGGALKNVGAQVFSLAAKFAGLAIGAGVAFAAVVRSTVNAGDDLATFSARVGLTVDQYAALQFSAAQADVETEQFRAGMDKLNKSMGEAKAGTGSALAFLKRVSPVLAEQFIHAKSTAEGVDLMSKAFAKLKDPAKRAALSAAVFGKSGMQIGEWLSAGGEKIGKEAERYLELVGSQEKFAASSGELDNAMRETETAFLGLRSAAAAGLFPALTKLSSLATDFIVEHRDGISRWATDTGATIERWVNGGGLERLGAQLGRVADGISKVVDFLGPMGVAAVGAAAVFGPLALSIGQLGLSLIGVMPTLIAFGGVLWTALAPLAPFIAAGAALGLLGKTIYDNWDELGSIFSDWGNSLRWAVVDAWNTVRPILAKLSRIPGLGGIAGGAIQIGGAVTGRVMETIEARRAIILGAEGARPANQSTSAAVSVDFANLPPGVRVSTEPNSSQPVNLSVGYSVMP